MTGGTAATPDRHEDLWRYFGSWLGFRQKYLQLPGVQVAVVGDGGVRFTGAYGQTDVAHALSLTDSSLFWVASHSKTFTAVAVMQLVEQGRLRLDARLGDVIGALAGSPVADVTIRDLLTHSAGISRDSVDGDFWQLRHEFPDQAQLLAIARTAEVATLEPNQDFKYSNLGYGLLGTVIETVTAVSYADHLREAIVAPLKLKDAGPQIDLDRQFAYATGYSALAYAADRVPIDHVDTKALAAAAGWYANASDLASFYATLLPGDTRLLSERSKRQLTHPVWDIKPGQDRYAMGVYIAKIGKRRLLGHSGGYPGHNTSTLVDVDRRVVVSVLTNAIDGSAPSLAGGLSRLLDLAIEADHAGAPLHAGRFTGRFAGLWGVLDVCVLDDRLFAIDPTVGDPSEAAIPLDVVDDHTLRIVGGPGTGSLGEKFQYRFDRTGAPSHVRGPNGMSMGPLDGFALPARVSLDQT